MSPFAANLLRLPRFWRAQYVHYEGWFSGTHDGGMFLQNQHCAFQRQRPHSRLYLYFGLATIHTNDTEEEDFIRHCVGCILVLWSLEFIYHLALLHFWGGLADGQSSAIEILRTSTY
jgi:hypothetical protein